MLVNECLLPVLFLIKAIVFGTAISTRYNAFKTDILIGINDFGASGCVGFNLGIPFVF